MTGNERGIGVLALTTLLAVGLTIGLGLMSGALPWWAIAMAAGVVLLSCLGGGLLAIRKASSRRRE